MKLKITLLALFSGYFSLLAQDKSYDFLKGKSETKIIYDRVFGISNATQIKSQAISTNYFLQVYNEMQRADFNERLPKLEVIKEKATLGFAQKQIPISLLITDFETIIPSEVNSTPSFEKHSINLIGSLLQKSKTNQVDFILKSDLIFNTTSRAINSISVNYNNSKEWKSITADQSFRINFTENGNQIIRFKMVLSTGQTIEQSIAFRVENQNSEATSRNNTPSTNAITTISSTIPYQGYGETAAFLGQGEYDIYMDTTDGVLDKPIFLLDGFDPGDTRNIPSIYSLLNYGSGQNLGDIVRAQGYDIIVLNFPTYTRPSTTTVVDGGVDYIQRNAMILVELINQINAQKVGTEKNVIIGPSMGGLIARYALRYMEMNSQNPDTRLYISFDSPHQGANVPIGFQHLFNYMAYGPLGNAAVQPIVDGLIKSPAAREMLIDQFEGHLQTGSTTEFNTASATLLPTGSPNFRTAFQNELNTMGFPTTTRNISIANGAGNGTMNYTPNFEVMNHTFNITTTQRAIINLRFTPAANQTNQVSRFRGQQFIVAFWITGFESLANSKAPTFTDGLDTAPGGRFDMTGFAGSLGTDPILTEFFTNLNADYFTFIPTWSSMAISNTNNLYTPVTATSVSPFVASSIPTINENHITFNSQNVAFALNEILNPVLNTTNPVLESIWIKNPVENSVEINSSYSVENANINITDMLGKTIYQIKNQNIIGTLEIPVTLSKGVYLITIGTENGSSTKKIIKN